MTQATKFNKTIPKQATFLLALLLSVYIATAEETGAFKSCIHNPSVPSEASIKSLGIFSEVIQDNSKTIKTTKTTIASTDNTKIK